MHKETICGAQVRIVLKQTYKTVQLCEMDSTGLDWYQ
jgi:hypothetical protein